VERIVAHGGIARVRITPFADRRGEVLGYQNVYECADGTRFGLTPTEEDLLIQHGDYLRAMRRKS
jgi:hypothetical protein